MYRSLIVAIVLLSAVARAEKAPAPFTDSSIERKLSNGKVQKFNGNEYIIVRRGVKKKVAPKPVVQTVEVVKEVTVTKTVTNTVEAATNKNAIILYGGYGPVGVRRNSSSEVVLKRDALAGVGYRRTLNKTFDATIMGLTNESVILGLGIGF